MEIWVVKEETIENGEGVSVLYNISDMEEDYYYIWTRVDSDEHYAIYLPLHDEEDEETEDEEYGEEEFKPYKVSWEDVPMDVKYAHFASVFPTRVKDNNYFYSYVIQQPLLYKKSEAWINAHKICTSHITMAVYEEIGEFSEVTLRRCYADVVRGVSNYEYIIDDKWLVTVYANESEFYPYHNYKISDYNEYKLIRKNRKRRAKRLAEKFNIPLEVASLTVNIKKDIDAELAIRKIKDVKHKAGERIIRQCGGTVDNKLDALCAIMGNYVYDLCPEEPLLDTLIKYLIK